MTNALITEGSFYSPVEGPETAHAKKQECKIDGMCSLSTGMSVKFVVDIIVTNWRILRRSQYCWTFIVRNSTVDKPVKSACKAFELILGSRKIRRIQSEIYLQLCRSRTYVTQFSFSIFLKEQEKM